MNPTGKKFVSLFLVFSLMAISCASLRTTGGKREKHGAKLIGTKKDFQQVECELITVKPNSLLLLSITGRDVSIDIGNIKVIKIVKKSNVLKGAGLGALIGGGTGVLLGGLRSTYEGMGVDPGGGRKILGVFGAVVGLLVGGTIGAISGTDITIQLEEMTDSEIQETLDYLRKKARIRDYK